MKKILLLLSLFTLIATVTFGQERLRTRNYTERPDTEPPYDKPLPVGVKIKKTSTSNARTTAPGKKPNVGYLDSSFVRSKTPIKAKTGTQGASGRKKSPARRPTGRH